MASDDIVQPVGKPVRPETIIGGDPVSSPASAPTSLTAPTSAAAPTVADAPATALPRGVRIATSVVGWAVGVISLIGAASMAYAATDYPPDLVMAAVLAAAGALVLPPVVGALRRVSPVLGSLWLPPLVYMLLVLSANPLSKLVAPQGAARQAYVARSLAAADQALKSHDPNEADRRMSIARDDAASNPAVKAMMARIEAERNAQLAAAEAAAKPASPVDPVQAKLAELKRVDDAFRARGRACKSALDAFNDAPDRVARYRTANDAAGACSGAYATGPSEVSVAVPQPFRDRLNADLNACDRGYGLVDGGLRETTRIDNGDVRASTISIAEYDLQDGQRAVNDCLAPYEADLAAAGLKKATAPADRPARSGTGGRHRSD